MTDASQSNTPEPEADWSGRQLGDFHVLRRLGRGAMAEVYLAEQGTLQRQVALKVLKSHLAVDNKFVRRFHHEAQAAAKLVHANIVQIYDIGERDGTHFIAQEYVQGQNLRELIARQGALDLKTVVLVLRQVALALVKAAESGIVHRDIKPENILLTRGGEVKVADFGLARVLDDRTELNLTQVGVTMGTPLYMSPEQVEGKAVDPRSDLYSLGVTCFHMLSGRPPFQGETALSVAVQHLKSEPPQIEALRPDCPPALARVVQRLMAKRPDDRYASARDLLRELRGVTLPGLEEGWWHDVASVEGLDFDTLPAMIESRRVLETIMHTQALVVQRQKKRRVGLLFAVVLAFAVGGVAAWFNRPSQSLLAGAKAAIPKQESAATQLFLAQMQLAQREAWLKSVFEYFPSDTYHVARAQQELVRSYLQQNLPDEALQYCESLERHTEPEFRAFALAGEAIALTMLKQYEPAAQKLAALWPLRNKLEPQMGRLLEFPIQANRRALDGKTAQGWDDWYRLLPKPAASDAEG